MSNGHFLFLTNVNETFSALSDYSKRFPNTVDFLLHSTTNESEHFTDLRNFKIINIHLRENTTIIFYLSGNLSIYIIDEYLKKFPVVRQKVICVFSALNLFLPKDYPSYNFTRQTIKIIESKSEDYLFLPVLMTEEVYERYFKKVDEKYFDSKANFQSLVIPNGNLIEKIIEVSCNNRNKEKIYIINTNYKLVLEKLARIKISKFKRVFTNIVPKRKQHLTCIEAINSMNRFAEQIPIPNLQNVNMYDDHNLFRNSKDEVTEPNSII